MAVISAQDFDHHEKVVFFDEKETGHKVIMAIHNTNRGPSIGGCRMWLYANEQQAITDALRLSRAMTYKAAMANLPFGGGKTVIIGDCYHNKTPTLFKAIGRFVEQLNGNYIIAEDVGTTVEDMAYINETTTHVAGLPGGSGDPSPLTALGIYESIQAAVDYRLGKSSLKGVKVAVQGLGHVGYNLCKLLANAEAELMVTDINPQLEERAATELKAKIVPSESIYSAEADIFSPCALGGIINDQTICKLKCKIIAGSANNQLKKHAYGEILSRMNILYAPDYVVNAGGLINISYEGPSYDIEIAKQHVRKIPHTLLAIFHKAKELRISTSKAADLIAEERFINR